MPHGSRFSVNWKSNFKKNVTSEKVLFVFLFSLVGQQYCYVKYALCSIGSVICYLTTIDHHSSLGCSEEADGWDLQLFYPTLFNYHTPERRQGCQPDAIPMQFFLKLH